MRKKKPLLSDGQLAEIGVDVAVDGLARELADVRHRHVVAEAALAACQQEVARYRELLQELSRD